MADEVKLITFAGETVSPLYDGLMQELYTGGGGIITGAVVTIKDASTLHITGGYGALCGREFEIFASDIPVTLSSSGTLKGRLYLHMDLAQSGAPIELLVEVAASLTPVVQDSDVNTTNGVYEVNLATFDVGTSAISNLVDVSPKLSKIPDQISSLNSALTWKQHGSPVTGNTPINISGLVFNELLVAVDIGNSGNMQTFVIPKVILKSSNQVYREGGYSGAQAFCMVLIDASLSSIDLYSATINNQVLTSSSVTTVYYK